MYWLGPVTGEGCRGQGQAAQSVLWGQGQPTGRPARWLGSRRGLLLGPPPGSPEGVLAGKLETWAFGIERFGPNLRGRWLDRVGLSFRALGWPRDHSEVKAGDSRATHLNPGRRGKPRPLCGCSLPAPHPRASGACGCISPIPACPPCPPRVPRERQQSHGVGVHSAPGRPCLNVTTHTRRDPISGKVPL